MKTRSQLTLAKTGFEKYTKTTRRAQLLAEMDRVVPLRRERLPAARALSIATIVTCSDLP